MNEPDNETPEQRYRALVTARDALCGCGNQHPAPTLDEAEQWAAVPIQCGYILHYTLISLLNHWHEAKPCDIGEYLAAAAGGFASAGPGANGAHIGAAVLRMLWHWYEYDEDDTGHPDYWGSITDADRRHLVDGLAAAIDAYNNVLDDSTDVEHMNETMAALKRAAAALGAGAQNVGLDNMDEADRTYVEASSLVGIITGRIAGMLSALPASAHAAEVGQRSAAVAMVEAARSATRVGSDEAATSALMAASMPLAWWLRDRADRKPRAGAVWRLMVAATMLNDADTIADADRSGYTAELGASAGDEARLVEGAVELMREALTSIELETK